MRLVTLLRMAVAAPAILASSAWLSPKAEAQIYAAVAPGGRTVAVNTPATFFVSMINAGTANATNCRIESLWSAVTLTYQATNAQNVPVGTPNTPMTIGPNQTQTFLMALSSAFLINDPNSVWVSFKCDQGAATIYQGVNTFVFNSVNTGDAERADIIPIAVTPSADAVIRVPDPGGIQIMAAAATNLGVVTPITVSPSFAANLRVPAALTVCETGAGGACLAAPSASVQSTINNGVKTFTVFADVGGTAGIPLWPADARVILNFQTGSGRVVGSANVAITAPTSGGDSDGIWFARNTLTTGNTSMRGVFFRGFGGASGPNRTNVISHVVRSGVIPGGSAIGSSPNSVRLCVSGACKDYLANHTFYPASGATAAPWGMELSFDAAKPEDGLMVSYPYPSATPGSYYPFTLLLLKDDAASDRQVSLASLAGSYAVLPDVAAAAGSPNRGAITISAAGALSGAFDGCTVGGNLIANPAGRNLFGVDNVAFSACGSVWSGSNYGGMAALISDTIASVSRAEVLTVLIDNEVKGVRLDLLRQ